MAHKTVVGSQAINLAGEEIVNFAQQSIFSSVFLEDSSNVAKNLINAMLDSPGYKLRSYIRWFKNTKKGKAYSDLLGYYYYNFSSEFDQFDLQNKFKQATPIPEHFNIRLHSISVGIADYSYWAEKYLLDNYPQYLVEDIFDCEYSFEYYNNKTVTIKVSLTGSGELIDTLTFEADTLDPSKEYLYANYIIYPLEPYTTDGETHYREPTTIVGTTHWLIYPRDTSTSSPEYNIGYSSLFPTYLTPIQKSNFVVPPIFIRVNNWQVSDATNTLNDVTDPEERKFLKALLKATSSPEFSGKHSSINSSIRNPYDSAAYREILLYNLSKIAYKRAFGAKRKYDELADGIAENDQIDDIDYAYVTFGVSINTKNWAGKQYLFNFVKLLYNQTPTTGSGSINIARTRTENAPIHGRNLNYRISLKWTMIGYGIMGKADDEFPEIPDWIKSAFTGSEKYTVVPADMGDYNFPRGNNSVYNLIPDSIRRNMLTNTVYFVHRKSKNSTQYEYYFTVGFTHYNYVIDGKSQTREAKAAFNYDKDDNGKDIYEESPFIVPIVEGVYRQLSGIAQAQLSQSFAYVVFNYYERKKIPWYATGLFKVIIIVVLIVIITIINIFTAGSASGAYGYVGWFAGLGAALGLGTLASVIIDALITTIVKMIIGMIVSKILLAGLRAIGIDGILAQIINLVAQIALMSGLDTFMAPVDTATTAADQALKEIAEQAGKQVTEQTSQNLGTTLLEAAKNGIHSFITDPVKLTGFGMQLADSISTGYFQSDMQKIQKESEQLQKTVKEQTNILREMDMAINNAYGEWAVQLAIWRLQTSLTPEAFLNISLLNGTEIAELSLEYLGKSLESEILILT